MKIKINGSTKPLYTLSKEEALDFSGKAARYMLSPTRYRNTF